MGHSSSLHKPHHKKICLTPKLQLREVSKQSFSYFATNKKSVCSHYKHLTEALLMGTHSICFRVEIKYHSFSVSGYSQHMPNILLTPYVNSDNSDELPI